MLVLSRKRDESVIIDVDGRLVEVLVVEIRGDKVRIAFEAAKDIIIHRKEVWNAIQTKQSQTPKNPQLPKSDG